MNDNPNLLRLMADLGTQFGLIDIPQEFVIEVVGQALHSIGRYATDNRENREYTIDSQRKVTLPCYATNIVRLADSAETIINVDDFEFNVKTKQITFSDFIAIGTLMHVVFTVYPLDEQGYPYIEDDEDIYQACLYYVIVRYLRKRFMSTAVPDARLQYFEAESHRLLNQARIIPYSVNTLSRYLFLQRVANTRDYAKTNPKYSR